MTKQRPRQHRETLSTPTPMEQFLYLLVEMENLLARKVIRWKPEEAIIARRRLSDVAMAIPVSLQEPER
jgi:hypothetical protein